MPEVDRGTCLRIVGACQQVLERAGCTVSQTNNDQHITLSITLPNPSSDTHGQRLMRIREQTT